MVMAMLMVPFDAEEGKKGWAGVVILVRCWQRVFYRWAESALVSTAGWSLSQNVEFKFIYFLITLFLWWHFSFLSSHHHQTKQEVPFRFIPSVSDAFSLQTFGKFLFNLFQFNIKHFEFLAKCVSFLGRSCWFRCDFVRGYINFLKDLLMMNYLFCEWQGDLGVERNGMLTNISSSPTVLDRYRMASTL